MRKPVAFLAAIAFVRTASLGSGAVAPNCPGGITKVASVGINEYELENGRSVHPLPANRTPIRCLSHIPAGRKTAGCRVHAPRENRS